MGLFSKNPDIPDPQVSLTLDANTRGPYQPGSRIAGTISLQTPIERQINLAELSFFGHAVTHSYRTESSSGPNNTRRSETIRYHDDTDIFRSKQLLLRDAVIFQDQRQTWPFEFTFPYAAQSPGPSQYVGTTAQSGIYPMEAHPLPPSFTHFKSKSMYAIVEYNIQASFSLLGREDPFIMQLQPDSLIFSPPAPTQPLQNALVGYDRPTQNYASSRITGAEQSLSHSIRDAFSSKTPSVNLTLKASLSSQLTTGASFPIYACVETSSPSTPDISIPTINLKITSLKLSQFTSYRARRVGRQRGLTSRNEHQVNAEDVVLLNALPETAKARPQHGIAADRKFTYYTAAFDARIPGSTSPSFRTFNINHNFRLKVTMEAEVCGKTFEHKFEVPDLVILPNANR